LIGKHGVEQCHQFINFVHLQTPSKLAKSSHDQRPRNKETRSTMKT
jgi:hypothetical protein